MNFVRNKIMTGYSYTTSYLSCMQTHLDLFYLPCVNSNFCTISFTLLSICVGMYTTFYILIAMLRTNFLYIYYKHKIYN